MRFFYFAVSGKVCTFAVVFGTERVARGRNHSKRPNRTLREGQPVWKTTEMSQYNTEQPGKWAK